MSRQSEAVKRWRANTKRRMVAAMGGSCVCCGYQRCNDALELHHIDPAEKEFSFGTIIANPVAWPRIVSELRKSVLLCSICHREVHAEIRQLPPAYAQFDNRYVDSKFDQGDAYNACPTCGKDKPVTAFYCSKSCAAKVGGIGRSKIEWNTIDLVEEMKTKTKTKIAEELGCSLGAIWKRLRKLKRVQL